MFTGEETIGGADSAGLERVRTMAGPAWAKLTAARDSLSRRQKKTAAAQDVAAAGQSKKKQ